VVKAIRTAKPSIDSEEERIVKQNGLNGDLEFIAAVGFGCKS
jgi:hypothetical protein